MYQLSLNVSEQNCNVHWSMVWVQLTPKLMCAFYSMAVPLSLQPNVCLSMFLLFCAAWMHFCSCGTSWGADWQCLLGIVLFGAWHPAWWTNAFWQNHRWRRRFFQYFLQWDGSWEACPSSCLRGSGTNCCRCVHFYSFGKVMIISASLSVQPPLLEKINQ